MAIEDTEQRLWRLRNFRDQLHLHSGSLESFPSIYKIFSEVMPDECYHLAAQSFVQYSFEDEFSTILINVNGTHHVLAALKELTPDCRIYFAGSSEMFGNVETTPQTETTVFHPRSMYGISKVTGFDMTRNYREAYGIYAACGILFNHESSRRSQEFVTRKITSQAAKIKLGHSSELRLGNLEARRDWGHSKDYVKAMWMMLQQEKPDDYVIASGEANSVREFTKQAFALLDLDYQDYVVEDPALFRPAEIHELIGDASKAERVLGWRPENSFNDLLREMVDSDMEIEQARSSHK